MLSNYKKNIETHDLKDLMLRSLCYLITAADQSSRTGSFFTLGWCRPLKKLYQKEILSYILRGRTKLFPVQLLLLVRNFPFKESHDK